MYVEGAVQGGVVLVSQAGSQTGGATTTAGTAPGANASSSAQAAPTMPTTTSAAGAPTTTTVTTTKEAYGLVRVVYREGQLLSQVVKPLKDQFSEKADLGHAYIVRGSERIGVDLEALSYSWRGIV